MNHRRLGCVARAEFRVQVVSPLWWGLVAGALLATLFINPAAMIPGGGAAVGGILPWSNSAHALAQALALSGFLLYTLPVCLLAGRAIQRDEEAGIRELLESTPLSPGEYLWGKLLGVLAALALALLIHLVMGGLWTNLGHRLGGDGVAGPFRLLNHLQPALLLMLPGLVCCSALALGLAALTRSARAGHALAVLLFVICLLGLQPRPEAGPHFVPPGLLDLMDIWGARWLNRSVFSPDRGIEFYNLGLLAVDGAVLARRLGLALLPLGFLCLVPGFLTLLRRLKSGSAHAHVPDDTVVTHTGKPLAAGPPFRLDALHAHAGPPGNLSVMRHVLAMELRLAAARPANLFLLVLAPLLVWDHATSARGIFDSLPLHRGGSLAVGMVELVGGLGCLLYLLHTTEALDRARRTGLAPLLLCSSASNVSLLLGVQLGGLLLVAAMLCTSLLAGLFVLVLQQGGTVDPWPFAGVWFGLLGPTFLFWSALVCALFVLTGRRQPVVLAGLALLAGTAILSVSGRMNWLLNWPLWNTLRWAQPGFLESEGSALWWNRGLVLAAAVLLNLLAVRHFPRRVVDRALRTADSGRLSRWILLLPSLAMVLCAAFLAIGMAAGPDGEVQRQRNTEYVLLNREAFSALPVPVIRHLFLKGELKPVSGELVVDGHYRLEAPADLHLLAFTVGRGFHEMEWTVAGQPVIVEDRAGLQVIRPETPLPAGSVFTVGFRYTLKVLEGYSRSGGGADVYILPSATLLHTLGSDFLPQPGYQRPDGESSGDFAGLPARWWQAELPPVQGNPRPFTARMEITAPADLTLVGVGRLLAVEPRGTHTRWVWESGHPVRFLSLLAGHWKVQRQAGAAVYYHPGQEANVPVLLNTLAAARRQYSAWFGDYPWPELRLCAMPAHNSRAQGFPTTINFSEDIGFFTRADDGAHLPEIVAAHEAAHQWWGARILPGRGPGADVLTESLANYSTLRLLEAELGPEARKDFASRLEEDFAVQRRIDREQPLLSVAGNDATAEAVLYDKGALVLWMLERHVGRPRMEQGLRTYVSTREDTADHPAVADLLALLRPAGSDSTAFDLFVDQWFAGTGLPEIRFEQVRVTGTGGSWRLQARVKNLGRCDARLELAAQDGLQSRTRTVDLLSGAVSFVDWDLPFRPRALVADPERHLLQLNRSLARADLPAEP